MSFQDKIIILDNVLTTTECRQLTQFYWLTNQAFEWKGSYPLNITEDMQSVFTKVVKIQNAIIPYLDQKILIDWCQIVDWPPTSFKSLHTDFKEEKTIFTSVTYLNDDYLGGHTFFYDGTIVAPKIGRTICFDGQYYIHGVNEVQKKDRFTLPIWYKNPE